MARDDVEDMSDVETKPPPSPARPTKRRMPAEEVAPEESTGIESAILALSKSMSNGFNEVKEDVRAIKSEMRTGMDALSQRLNKLEAKDECSDEKSDFSSDAKRKSQDS